MGHSEKSCTALLNTWLTPDHTAVYIYAMLMPSHAATLKGKYYVDTQINDQFIIVQSFIMAKFKLVWNVENMLSE